MTGNQSPEPGIWTYMNAIEEVSRLAAQTEPTRAGAAALLMLALECRMWLSEIRTDALERKVRSWRN